MSGAETHILSCRVCYLVFRIRKGWTGLECQHRRGPVALTGWGSCCPKGLASRRDGRWVRANCGRPSVAWISTPGVKIVDVRVRQVQRQCASRYQFSCW